MYLKKRNYMQLDKFELVREAGILLRIFLVDIFFHICLKILPFHVFS